MAPPGTDGESGGTSAYSFRARASLRRAALRWRLMAKNVMARRRLVAVAATLSVVISGCFSTFDTETEDRAEPIEQPLAESSAAPQVDGAPCEPAPADMPADSGCLTRTIGDFDGDGAPDDLAVYASLDDGSLPISWRARIDLGSGETITEALKIGSVFSYPTVLGAEDADGDGADEAFLKTKTHLYHSGAIYEVGIFKLGPSRFFQVHESGSPLNFQIGAISYFSQGAECRDVDFDGKPEFVLLAVDGVINDVQKWNERIYGWRGDSLVFLQRKEGKMAKTGYNDPMLRRFYGIRCFTFDPPAPF